MEEDMEDMDMAAMVSMEGAMADRMAAVMVTTTDIMAEDMGEFHCHFFVIQDKLLLTSANYWDQVSNLNILKIF